MTYRLAERRERKTIIRFLVSANERDALIELAKNRGMTISEYVRDCCIPVSVRSLDQIAEAIADDKKHRLIRR